MSSAICRVVKMKAGAVGGISSHNIDRESNTNPDIDHNRSDDNYQLHQKEDRTEITDLRQEINDRIEELDLKRAPRKDAVVMCEVLFTSDSSFFSETLEMYDADGSDLKKKFFEDCYDFACERWGKENIVSAIVHMDEKTPHMHLDFVPVTEDGRLSAKDVFRHVETSNGEKIPSYRDLQDKFFEAVGEPWGLDRGERGSTREHIEMARFKENTALENVEKLEVERDTLVDCLGENISMIDELQSECSSIVALAREDLETVKLECTIELEKVDVAKAELLAIKDDISDSINDITTKSFGEKFFEFCKETYSDFVDMLSDFKDWLIDRKEAALEAITFERSGIVAEAFEDYTNRIDSIDKEYRSYFKELASDIDGLYSDGRYNDFERY